MLLLCCAWRFAEVVRNSFNVDVPSITIEHTVCTIIYAFSELAWGCFVGVPLYCLASLLHTGARLYSLRVL